MEAEAVDAFGIPDEPESYESHRQTIEQKAVKREYEKQQEESQRVEKLEEIPTDYDKKIAEMDEDMREAMEILVTECSCYTPFKPFLQDIVNSNYLFTPNKLELLSDMVLGNKEERKGYGNNNYGLIEYTLKPYEINMNYKNRFGEREMVTTGYRELYEVLSYMSKQPFFCGDDQRQHYDKMMATEDRTTLQPIYQTFLDKCDSIKQNLGEQAQRESTTATGNLNFHFNLWELPRGGAKTRYQWNIEAIGVLKQVESEHRLANREEQKILSKYVGWGGISQVFDENNENWKREFVELKSLLTEKEYTAARATVNNAFYTSPEIASCMNQALLQFGFRGGNVLEPSMGVGNFFGSMATPLQNCKLYGVELDSISGRIAK